MSEEEYSFMSTPDLDSVVETSLLPAGTECQLEVKSVKTDNDLTGEKGKRYILPFLMPVGDFQDDQGNDVFPDGFNHYMGLPINEGEHAVFDDARSSNRKRLQYKAFLDALGFEGKPESPDELVGYTCTAILGVEVDKNGVYPDKNRIQRFVPNSH